MVLSAHSWFVVGLAMLGVGCLFAIRAEARLLRGRWRLAIAGLIVLGFGALGGSLLELLHRHPWVAVQIASSGIALITLPRVVYGAQRAHEELLAKLDELQRQLTELGDR
jgi:hypothetical protein